MRSIHWIFITANGHEIDFAGRNTGFPGFAFHRLSGPTRFVARSSPCSARASRTLEIQVDPNPWISRVQKSTNEHRVLPWRVFFLSKLGYKKQHLSSKLVLSNGSDIMAAAAAILARPCARERRCVKFRGGAVRTSYRLSRLIFFEVSLSQNWVI
jgi:hypothetical protein